MKYFLMWVTQLSKDPDSLSWNDTGFLNLAVEEEEEPQPFKDDRVN